MAKLLLVEDDNNLREIYQARLMAEGYDIVAAQDGEEALVMAKKEKPDLIISDVMMPRISGFEMLDILRNTEGLRDTKIIMLTALSQNEDQTRADKLGADKYLVKSQVTLEDIVKSAKQLLGDNSADEAEVAVPPTAEPTPTPATEAPIAVTPAPEPTPAPAPETAVAVEPAPAPTAAATPAPEPTAAPTPAPAATPSSDPIAPAPTPATEPAIQPATAPVPEPTSAPDPTPAPAPEPAVAVEPTPAPEPTVEPATSPTIEAAATTPAVEPAAPATVVEPGAAAPEVEAAEADKLSQSLAAEEKAIEEQIHNFASEPGVDPQEVVPQTTDEAKAEANDTAVLENAVDKLNSPEPTPEPALPPSQKTVPEAPATPVTAAPTPTPAPEPAVAVEPAPAPEPASTTPTPDVNAEVSNALAVPAPAPTAEGNTPASENVTVAGKKVIKPLNDNLNSGPKLEELLAKEAANTSTAGPTPVVGTGGPNTPPPPQPGGHSGLDPTVVSL